MNLLEFRLLAYKKRNWQYVIMDYSPLINELGPIQPQVAVKEATETVILYGTNTDELKQYTDAVITVLTYKPLIIISDSKWDTNFEMHLEKVTAQGLISNLDTKFLDDHQAQLRSPNILSTKANLYNEYCRVLTGALITLSRVLLSSSQKSMQLQATMHGALNVAKASELIDFETFTLGELDTIYDTILASDTTLHYLEYYIL